MMRLKKKKVEEEKKKEEAAASGAAGESSGKAAEAVEEAGEDIMGVSSSRGKAPTKGGRKIKSVELRLQKGEWLVARLLAGC